VQTTLDCIPCFARQALEAARFASDDEAVRQLVVREALAMLATEVDLGQPPPVTGQRLHRLVRGLAAHGDPYAALKRRANADALAALPRLRDLVLADPDPLAAAVRVTIAANVLDAGMNAACMEEELRGDGGDRVFRLLARGIEEPLHGDVEAFREAVAAAGQILFLADNTGEIVVDKLLLEQFPAGRVTVAVRGRPVLNDATREDARVAGIGRSARVIDNGSDAPGTLLDDCSPAFRRAFADADVIVAKGQGNYESLSDAGAAAFFLFLVKCPLVAAHAGLPLGARVLVGPASGGPRERRG
jgi:uncharacterized protein with ATP-grasp and redox domains